MLTIFPHAQCIVGIGVSLAFRRYSQVRGRWWGLQEIWKKCNSQWRIYHWAMPPPLNWEKILHMAKKCKLREVAPILWTTMCCKCAGKSLKLLYQMSDFKAKMHQIRFQLGLCPRPCWGSFFFFFLLLCSTSREWKHRRRPQWRCKYHAKQHVWCHGLR